MGMCKAPKVPGPSEAESYQAQIALNRVNEYETDGFSGLENDAISISKNDLSGVLKGRASADLNGAQAATEKTLGLYAGQGSAPSEQTEQTKAFTPSLSSALQKAGATAASIKDKNLLDMAGVGQDVSANVQSNVAQTARRGVEEARTKMNNDTLRSRARTQALVDAASGVVSGAMMGGKSSSPSLNSTPQTGKPFVLDPEGSRYA